MTTDAYKELRREVVDATAEAENADHAWQRQLDLLGVERYSRDAQRGVFENLYVRKLRADEKMRQANDALRSFRQ